MVVFLDSASAVLSLQQSEQPVWSFVAGVLWPDGTGILPKGVNWPGLSLQCPIFVKFDKIRSFWAFWGHWQRCILF
jgi:hypothetical protein